MSRSFHYKFNLRNFSILALRFVDSARLPIYFARIKFSRITRHKMEQIAKLMVSYDVSLLQEVSLILFHITHLHCGLYNDRAS